MPYAFLSVFRERFRWSGWMSVGPQGKMFFSFNITIVPSDSIRINHTFDALLNVTSNYDWCVHHDFKMKLKWIEIILNERMKWRIWIACIQPQTLNSGIVGVANKFAWKVVSECEQPESQWIIPKMYGADSFMSWKWFRFVCDAWIS